MSTDCSSLKHIKDKVIGLIVQPICSRTYTSRRFLNRSAYFVTSAGLAMMTWCVTKSSKPSMPKVRATCSHCLIPMTRGRDITKPFYNHC